MDRICAGIVTFNPDISILVKDIESIIDQVEEIYLCDNNSVNINEVDRICKQYGIILPKLKENYSIVKALNVIFLNACQSHYDWILTLDQDSLVPTNIINEYIKCINEVENCGLITCRINFNNQRLEQQTEKYLCINSAITSASMISIKSWKEVGGFDECMFIDGVDHEFCYRLRMTGYSIVKVRDVVLEHELGELKVYKIFGKKINVENHNSFRVYYISRNYIYCHRKHSGYSNKKVLLISELKLIFKIVFFEKDKIRKLKRISSGIKDGIRMDVTQLDYANI